MTDLLTHTFADDVNRIVLDDGKANAMSVQMLAELNAALDLAEQNGGLVVIRGRAGVFSGGFDLGVFKRGDQEEIFSMLKAGALLTERLLSFPNPTIALCTGHAIAMGAFILLSTDFRIAMEGDFKFAANEVAIGLTVPRFATEVCRLRLSPAAFNSGLPLARYYDCESAQQAGFIDQLVAPDKLDEVTAATAKYLLALDRPSHTATKLRVRTSAFTALRIAIEEDCAEWEQRYGS
ncbi:MAG: crotonase/enoyl-CoA hydratase family protein [Gammaproteobacteria bacterium]